MFSFPRRLTFKLTFQPFLPRRTTHPASLSGAAPASLWLEGGHSAGRQVRCNRQPSPAFVTQPLPCVVLLKDHILTPSPADASHCPGHAVRAGRHFTAFRQAQRRRSGKGSVILVPPTSQLVLPPLPPSRLPLAYPLPGRTHAPILTHSETPKYMHSRPKM